MKTLYLHIGLPKTATTTIQHFLVVNQTVLRNEGWLYPNAGRQYLAHHLLGNFFRPDPLYWIGQADPAACYRVLMDEVDGSGCDKVIMSTESLYFTPDPSVIPLYFKDFRVVPVVFLRRQDEWLESAYREGRKNAELQISIEAYFEHMRPWMDYAATLKKWQAGFPGEKIIVGVFEKGAKQVSAEQKFLQSVGADIKSTLTSIASENETLSRDALEFYTRFRDQSRIDARHQMFKAGLSAYSKRHPDPVEVKTFLPPSRLREIIEIFDEGNSWVAENYLPPASALFSGAVPSNDTPWQDYSGLSTQTAGEIAEFLVNWVYRQLAKEE